MSDDGLKNDGAEAGGCLAEIVGYVGGYLALFLVVGFFALIYWIFEQLPQEHGAGYLMVLIVCIGGSAAFWYFILRSFDSYTPIRARYFVFLILAGGVMSTFPAGYINHYLFLPAGGMNNQYSPEYFQALLAVGLNEEFWKLLATTLLIWNSREIREPLDVVVSAGAVGLGFATVENIGYMIQYGNHEIVGRSLTAVPLHLLVSGIWGYGLAYTRFHPSTVAGVVERLFPLLIVSAIVHDLYNVIVTYIGTYVIMILFLWGLLVRLFEFCGRDVLYSHGTSCSKCSNDIPAFATHCPHCYESARSSILPSCPTCSANHLWTARYCHNCGRGLAGWKTLRRSTVRRLLPRRRRTFRRHQAA